MANNPKKAKDPTEVALSAIQEALNISDSNADPSRSAARAEPAPPTPPLTPAFNEPLFDHRPGVERPAGAQRLYARHALCRRLAHRLRPSYRELPALAAGHDRPGLGRTRDGRPCLAVLRTRSSVLFPREPRLARPGTAHDRAIDGA